MKKATHHVILKTSQRVVRAAGWSCGIILKRLRELDHLRSLGYFYSTKVLLICTICEIKINFIWLWISPNPSKSKILFKWLKNKTEIHSSRPWKEFSDGRERVTEVRTVGSPSPAGRRAHGSQAPGPEVAWRLPGAWVLLMHRLQWQTSSLRPIRWHQTVLCMQPRHMQPRHFSTNSIPGGRSKRV